MPGFLLPVYDLIDDGSLLGRGFAEINAGGFDAFVSHEVGEESDVIAALQEALCEAVTETSLDKGTQRKTTENELPSLTQCTA